MGSGWGAATAEGHTAALKTDGTLWAWGYNLNGQVGDGTTSNRISPAQVGSDNRWASVAAGFYFTVAIKTDGTLWAWGANSSGQLGDGSTSNRSTPVPIGNDNRWSTLAPGGYHTLALKKDGTLWSWGSNSMGQLGDGTTTNRSTPAQIGSDNQWSMIAAGGYHSLAVKKDGTLWAWGSNGFGQLADGSTSNRSTPAQVGSDNHWALVAAGSDCLLAVKTDGTLWAAGNNYSGQLGDGTTTNRSTLVQIGSDGNWRSVTAYTHTVAVKTDGTLWAWGDNAFGELGDGTTTNRTTPTQIGNDDRWAAAAAGIKHSVALRSDGTLWGTGDDAFGELGYDPGYNPRQVVLTPVIAAWPTASGISFGQPLAASTLAGGTVSVGGSFAFITPSAVPSAAGSYSASVRFSPADGVNCLAIVGTVTVPVGKGTPVVSAWPTAGGITFGQALSASRLTSGAASVAGTFSFTAPSAVPQRAGAYSAAVTFTPADAADYLPVSGTIGVFVAPPALNGACGASRGKAFVSAPSVNLCSAGQATSVTLSGTTWSWSCKGENGGLKESCAASDRVPPSPALPEQGKPTMNVSGIKAGTTFTIYRTGGGLTSAAVYTGMNPTFTDTSALKPNTIYQYAVSSDTDASLSMVTTIRTPLYGGWNIVAVPCDTTGADPASFFATPVSAIYRWIPSGATFEESDRVLGAYSTVGSLLPGNGYFVKASDHVTLLTCSGKPGPASATVILKPGWTMIANPTTTDKSDIATSWLLDGAPLAWAITANKVGGGVYWWNGTTYDSWSIMNDNPQIEPWKGYWILNIDSVNHTLTIQ
jgi:alpha-tubulin suppressor-like RCC1 family protein